MLKFEKPVWVKTVYADTYNEYQNLIGVRPQHWYIPSLLFWQNRQIAKVINHNIII